MTVLTNGSSQDFDMVGDLNVIILQLYYNADYIAMILDFKDVCSISGVRVKMDTEVDGFIYVQLSTGQIFKIIQCSKGLYYFDKDRVDDDTTSETFNYYTNIQSVKDNTDFFTKQEIEEADKLRDYQENMCFPSTTALQSYIRNNLIENCGFYLKGVNWEKVIYGPAVPDLQGKMTQRRSPMHGKIVKIPLPPVISKHHLNIAMFMDSFFCKQFNLFNTRSHQTNFLSAQH